MDHVVVRRFFCDLVLDTFTNWSKTSSHIIVLRGLSRITVIASLTAR